LANLDTAGDRAPPFTRVNTVRGACGGGDFKVAGERRANDEEEKKTEERKTDFDDVASN